MQDLGISRPFIIKPYYSVLLLYVMGIDSAIDNYRDVVNVTCCDKPVLSTDLPPQYLNPCYMFVLYCNNPWGSWLYQILFLCTFNPTLLLRWLVAGSASLPMQYRPANPMIFNIKIHLICTGLGWILYFLLKNYSIINNHKDENGSINT